MPVADASHKGESMVQARSLVLTSVLVFAACAESSAVEVDLSEFGVASFVRDGSAHHLRDAGGRSIGRVDIATRELRVELRGTAATLGWDDATGTASCNGHSFTVARRAGESWELTSQPGTTLEACGDALNVAEAVAAHAGADVPWRGHVITSALLASDCVSTWVFGSSCSSCRNAACRATNGNNPCAVDSSSCDSGTTYTTCTACFQ
jgi:hypothetical protein